MTPYERFIQALGATPRRGSLVRCPAHEDSSASLSLKQLPDGGVLFHCHAGCRPKAILDSLRLTWADILPEQIARDRHSDDTGAQIPYHYLDADGTYCHTNIRLPGKRFTRKYWADGHLRESHELSEEARAALMERAPLYNLPRVRAEAALHRVIIVTEGEKDAEAWQQRGYAATCPYNSSGPWNPAWSAYFKGASEIWVVADKDRLSGRGGPGEKHASEVATALASIAPVKVIEAPGKHKDSYDFFQAGGEVSGFEEWPNLDGPLEILDYKVFSEDFTPPHPEFLVEPFFRRGRFHLIDSAGGTGKTSLLLSLAADMSRGTCRIPVCRTIGLLPTRTLYLLADADDPDEYQAIYAANKGVPGMLALYPSYPPDPLNDAFIRKLERTIQHFKAEFVVLDPLAYFLQAAGVDINFSKEVGPAILALGNLAQRTNSVICGVRHTAKQGEGANAGVGSHIIKDMSRKQLLLQEHPNHPGMVLVEDLRGAIRTPKGDPFCFFRVGDEIHYRSDFTYPPKVERKR